MSKAEERSKEIMHAALNYANNLDDVKPIDGFSRNLCIALGQAFIKGAEWSDEHQAEKDSELSWEDIKKINDIATDMSSKFEWQSVSIEQYFKEVLKRFKDFKERKEK